MGLGEINLHLEEMKKEIETLVLEKGFYSKSEDIPKKFLFAFIELGEASDNERARHLEALNKTVLQHTLKKCSKK